MSVLPSVILILMLLFSQDSSFCLLAFLHSLELALSPSPFWGEEKYQKITQLCRDIKYQGIKLIQLRQKMSEH